MVKPGRTIFWTHHGETNTPGVFTSVQELEEKMMVFIHEYNKERKPFVWTKSAEEILNKVKRAKTSLSNLQSV